MTNKALKLVCLGILVLVLGIPSLAQNTKGDRPAPPTRESRFKTPKKTKQKRQPSRRVRRGDDRVGAPAQIPSRKRTDGERPGKPVSPQFSKSRPSQSERAWKGDLSGRRIQPRRETSRAKNVYPQPDNINYSSQNFKQKMKANENPNVKRVRRMQHEDPGKARVGRPIRPTFHKARRQQHERAWRGDITGRPIRAGSSDKLRPSPGAQPRILGVSVRPRTQRAGVVPPRVSGRARNSLSRLRFFENNQSRKYPQVMSDRDRFARAMLNRYNNRRKPVSRVGKVVPRTASSGYRANRSTNTWAHFPRPKRKQERAITTDLAGKKLRTRNYETPRAALINPTLKYQKRVPLGDRASKSLPGGYSSRTRSGRAWIGDIAHRAIRGGFRSKKGEARPGAPLFGKGPGRVDMKVGRYQGNIKGRRAFDEQGENYSGNIRTGRPLKGGGSVSGLWNNKGQPINGRTPGRGADRIGYSGNIRAGRKGFNDQGEEYSGNIKTGRRGFNEQGEEYRGNIRVGKKGFNDQGEEFSGNIKGGRRGFNDQGEEYRGNIRVGRKGFNDQGEEFTGNIKARRPEKGGGSVSGRVWNNRNTPILVRTPTGKSAKIAGYQGDIRRRKKVFDEQGEGYSGDLKAHRPEKGGESVSGKLWNNDEKAVEGKSYRDQTKLSRFTGGKKVSRGDYGHNPKSVDDALPGMKASAASVKADQHSKGVRKDWDYIKNPSSADEAQKTREPGRAFGRSADFQGNIRVKKFDLFGKSDLHPDARFVKTNKNNVDEERDMLTNFKLWWARLFRKAETQPDHLKENDKDRKPRYDKGEAGLWYE